MRLYARQCNEFMKLGLQGVSIAIASGDYGVASVPGDGGPNGCLGPEGKIFNTQYPCNCPYVTCVGGTQLYANQTVLDKEIGFVNPVLYANPGVLNDIVNGTSLGSDGDGFQAVPGYVIDFGDRLSTY